MTGNPEDLSPKQIAQIVNGEFRSGQDAYHVLPLIRALSRPVCVDLNNVLINNSDPVVANPEASRFLNILRSTGNVFIVTTADSWQYQHDHLQRFRLWHEDMILMTYPTWQFMHEWHSSQKDELVDDYIRFMSLFGVNFSSRDFFGSSFLGPSFLGSGFAG